MKKIILATACVVAGLSCSAFTFGASMVAADSPITSASEQARPMVAEKSAPLHSLENSRKKNHFLYLDMVQRKRPDAIRNAVILYGHPLMKKQACPAHDEKDVRECWLGPVA